MQLTLMTWPEVEARLERGACVMLPIGSVEQHGPMGLIGTDVICATEVALRAADRVDAIVAPAISYTSAPFNTGFPGTVSVTPDLVSALVLQVCQGLLGQGISGVFIVNGHGANLDPIAKAQQSLPAGSVKIQSWWEPPEVNTMRAKLYGEWEGMHATPSEVAITQALYGAKPVGAAADPPELLSADYIRQHSGDRHGPPDKHRADFPDGRVGSHSALATPEHGQQLLDLASTAIADQFVEFSERRRSESNLKPENR
ncbi:MAG: creatininase family protein [Pseudomonadota bacterium]